MSPFADCTPNDLLLGFAQMHAAGANPIADLLRKELLRRLGSAERMRERAAKAAEAIGGYEAAACIRALPLEE